MDVNTLKKIATYIRYCILKATNQAGSGHPTSSLSATELMTGLLFGGAFHYDADHPEHPNNDRLIFSKGHASPLFYALWAAAGKLTLDDMLTYRTFGSPLEGHPTVSFPYTEAATGSLGQGLAIGVGMALNAKYLDKLPYRTYVLLGDSEMAEGSQWESIQIAVHYGLNNLVGVLDVNRLGQRGETMYGYDLDAYDRRLAAFGWQTVVIDGHSLPDVVAAYETASRSTDKPVMIIAKTVKGKGVPSVENANGWHGKALGEDALKEASKLWGQLDQSVRGTIPKPKDVRPAQPQAGQAGRAEYAIGDKAATRDAYGPALNRICAKYPNLVALDGEVSNSTRADKFADEHPDRFFEMYIAEQNMVGTALGLARRGKIPFVSTFAAFLTRAFDQIRMSQYSDANIKFVGSHAGVSIGEDGPSQMALEDLAMFRPLLGSVVLYPSDAVAADKLVETAAQHEGIVYLRMTRSKTPVIYGADEAFPIGGSKTLRASEHDVLTVVSAGYTLHESLAAYDELRKEDIAIRVVDLYSIKPLDVDTLRRAAAETGDILVVEYHYAQGGIGEAVFHALLDTDVALHHLAVTSKPRSGPAGQQLDYQGISRKGIAAKVRQLASVSAA
jgi:transketolase